MGLIRNLKRNPQGPLIILASIAVWIFFAIFLPGHTSSASENMNTIIESLFVVMTFLPIGGIGYGIYTLIMAYNKS